MNVAEKLRGKDSAKPLPPMLIASTAHYEKFLSSCKHTKATTNPPHHLVIKNCLNKPVVHSNKLDSNLNDVMFYLEDFLQQCFS